MQNLLEVTRLESGEVKLHKELYHLDEVAGNALERLDPLLKGREVNGDFAENLPPVPMDAVLMEQVFINLLENAVRHTPAKSPIDLQAEEDNGFVEVAVSDRGPGLQEDELERVFDKSYHSPSSPGAGLGLAICRAIIQAHGGSIRAGNRTGGGAVFRFTFPLEDSHGH